MKGIFFALMVVFSCFGQTLAQTPELEKVTIGDISFTFEPPQGWTKQTGFSAALLGYVRMEDSFSGISVVKDKLKPGVNDALEYTRQLRNMLLSGTIAGSITISEPGTATVAGYNAAIFDMHDNLKNVRFYWYQFLLGDTVVSLQFSARDSDFDRYFPVFEKFCQSMHEIARVQ